METSPSPETPPSSEPTLEEVLRCLLLLSGRYTTTLRLLSLRTVVTVEGLDLKDKIQQAVHNGLLEIATKRREWTQPSYRYDIDSVEAYLANLEQDVLETEEMLAKLKDIEPSDDEGPASESETTDTTSSGENGAGVLIPTQDADTDANVWSDVDEETMRVAPTSEEEADGAEILVPAQHADTNGEVWSDVDETTMRLPIP